MKSELEIAHLHEKFEHLHEELLERLAALEKVARGQVAEPGAKAGTQTRIG